MAQGVTSENKLLRDLLVEHPWLEQEIQKKARGIALPMARQLASIMVKSKMAGSVKKEIDKIADDLIVSIALKLLGVLFVAIQAIKGAANRVDPKNRAYFTFYPHGNLWRLYFAVGFKTPGENFEAYGIDLSANEALKALSQRDEITKFLINLIRLEVDPFDLNSSADRLLFKQTISRMNKLP